MISKSKLGAIAFMAAIGFASPAFAQMQKGPLGDPSSLHAFTMAAATNYGPSATGGGSAGYNHDVATDYRLRHHHVKPHASAKPHAAKSSQ